MTKYNKRDDYSKIEWEFPEEVSSRAMQEILKRCGKTCPVCKKVFLSDNRPRKYCSDTCAKRASKKVIEGNFPTFTIFSRDGFRCHYCGRSPHKDPDVILRVDHITPRSKGGALTEENLITSCQKCNLEKNNKLLDPEVIEFLKT